MCRRKTSLDVARWRWRAVSQRRVSLRLRLWRACCPVVWYLLRLYSADLQRAHRVECRVRIYVYHVHTVYSRVLRYSLNGYEKQWRRTVVKYGGSGSVRPSHRTVSGSSKKNSFTFYFWHKPFILDDVKIAVIWQQFWMKECDILGLKLLLHIFRGSRPPIPRIYTPEEKVACHIPKEVNKPSAYLHLKAVESPATPFCAFCF